MEEKCYDEFVERSGSPRQEAAQWAIRSIRETEQGPQVDDIQFDKVMGYIESGKHEGAEAGVRRQARGRLAATSSSPPSSPTWKTT